MPRRREEAYDRWRKRIKYDLLLLKAEKADGKEKTADTSEGKTPEQRLSKRYHSFSKRMGPNRRQELLEMYLTSLTTAFDPHTTYMSPASVENFEIMMQLKLEGIGASLQGIDGYTVVKKIIPGGAAEKERPPQAGRQDHRRRRRRKSGELVDVVDMKLNDVVKMIRGKHGTVVRLQAISLKEPKPHIVKITREEIQLKDSEPRRSLRRRPQERRQALPRGRDQPAQLLYGYGRRPARRPELQEHDPRRPPILDEFKQQGVDAVVMDLGPTAAARSAKRSP